MSFFKIATSGGHLAKYLGALLKRAAPSEGNYKRLKPGDEVSCTIDLGQFFEFKSSDGDDNYIIKYSVTSMELFKPTSVNTTNALEMLESNTLKIKIGDRVSPFQRNLRERSLQTLNSFSSCTTAQQTSIIEARSHAITASNNAVAIIESVGVSQSTSACPRYKEWFGPYDSSRHTELVNGYRTSRERLTFASIKFDCGCNQDSHYNIYLCKVFWSAPMTGTDSKMGTIIHEMTHFTVTADTDDNAYGQSNCKSLAINNPLKSVNNADSHEYAAENTPALACSVVTSKPTTSQPTPKPTSKPSTSLPTSLKPTSNIPKDSTSAPTAPPWTNPPMATPTNSPTTTSPTTTKPTTTKPTATTCRAKTQSCKKTSLCSNSVDCIGSLTCCCCSGLSCRSGFCK